MPFGRKRPGWTVILVPPHAGAEARRLTLTTRGLRGAALVVVASVAVAGLWVGETSNYAALTASQLAASQRVVVSLMDSVSQLTELAEARLPPRHMVVPVSGEITSGFSATRLHPILSVFRAHRGVDMAAPAGTPIVAAAAGRVISVGRHLGYGLTVEVEHGGEVVTRYAHCQKAIVNVGDFVRAGHTIALVGSSGLATGPHLHFEVLLRGKSIDPISFIAASLEQMQPAQQGHPTETSEPASAAMPDLPPRG
jgi:murein DD-endopeptidase MepM/ murein hydrolase activator NlpD